MVLVTRPNVLTVLLEYIDLVNLSGNIRQSSITLTEETPFNASLQYHPYNELPYYIAHAQIITMWSLGGVFTYYAGIMLDAILYLLCS